MKLAEPSVRNPVGRSNRPPSLWNSGAVLLGALIMAWPAFYNGFPVLYPDSMTYLDDGRIVARAVFLHQLSDYYGMRSLIYSLGILPLHWNVTLWPVVALQCLMTAFILWLVVRSLAPRRMVSLYLVVVLLLSGFTGMSWYAAMVMPDFLGPVLYLSIYLIVFARESLTRAERLSLYPIAWWAIVSHSTHLLLSGGLWLLLAIAFVVNRRDFSRGIRPICEVAAVISVAVASQLLLNGYLYGKPSLDAERPPFLTARIIADGPGRLYLEKHCGELKWVICEHVQHLTDDVDNFLWAPDGIYQGSSEEDQQLMVREELPFVLATVRAYPFEQFQRSFRNFWEQLLTFDFADLDASSYVLDEFNPVMPRARASYVKSLQARNELPLSLLTSVQNWTVVASLAAIAVFSILLWRRHSRRIVGLALVIVSMVVANAAVTGVLSMVEGRFECRVIWLIPLLAGMCALDWYAGRSAQLSPQSELSR